MRLDAYTPDLPPGLASVRLANLAGGLLAGPSSLAVQQTPEDLHQRAEQRLAGSSTRRSSTCCGSQA